MEEVFFLFVLLSFVVTGLAPNYTWRAKFLANVGLVSQKHKKFSYLIELYRKLALLYFVTIQDCLCLFLGTLKNTLVLQVSYWFLFVNS